MRVRALALPDRRSSGFVLFAATVVAALTLWLVVAGSVVSVVCTPFRCTVAAFA